MRYPVVIHKDRKSDYGVTVPDLPGCFSAGDTMEEALTNAVEAIECHLEGLLLDGDEIPQAQPVEEHLKNRDYAGGTWALVSVDLSQLAARRSGSTSPCRSGCWRWSMNRPGERGNRAPGCWRGRHWSISGGTG